MSNELGIDRSGNNNNWTVHSLDMNDDLTNLIEKSYGVKMNVPLLLESKIGPNWLDVQDV